MNENYLWDKTGERDPEIERLEDALASLRYKRPSRPLPLPIASRPQFRLNIWLAAAAAIALLILAGGLWLALHRSVSNEQRNGIARSAAPKAAESPKEVSAPPTVGTVNPTVQIAGDKKSDKSSETITPRAPHKLNSLPQPVERRQEIALRFKNRELALREEETIRKGELAKEQLIKALQITSDKLNTLQKKIQGNQEHNPIS
ncbi:MAG TPA: hypothetical protein VKB86_13950 [Pyrinomonadaceae bacterium]|nr:hypothetical protein [Pyrinomonadaceae bacterium]